MHLKSLTLRGFKSFAGSTTLVLEPGVTCVVGPNGSGKSNVVDAIAWVLGEQGAKSLRGGKMEDVIFAGSPGRPPLGRAEVVLTIDNADGALPIEYTEVTIGRLMYRSGESEYAINGSPCRLLDVQELLSDSGIGRELHVLVGQGSLDSVLGARPEDRRSFVEEAAGVLKHRKRKERALRKLDATASSLERLQDLSAELRRQLGPLGRQAEAARTAGAIQAVLRDARLRLLADDVLTSRRALQGAAGDEAARRERLAGLDAELALLAADEQREAAGLAGDVAAASAARDTWHALTRLGERLAGVRALAEQRSAAAQRVEPPRTGRDPEALEADAEATAAAEAALERDLAEARTRLATAEQDREAAEAALAADEQAARVAAQAAADSRESIARLRGQVETARGRLAAAGAEDARLAAAAAAARARADRARAAAEQAGTALAALDVTELALDAGHEEAQLRAADARAALQAAEGARHAALRELSTRTATRDALALSLERPDGTQALLTDVADGQDAPDPAVLGAVAELLGVEPGWEAAIAAALGPVADGVAVRGLARAVQALAKADAAGQRLSVLIADRERGTADAGPMVGLPDGARRAMDVLTVPPEFAGAAARLLGAVVLVADRAAAAAVLARFPHVHVVTRHGDRISTASATGGAPGAPSVLQLAAAVTEAGEQLAAAEAQYRQAEEAVLALGPALAEAEQRAAAALERLHDSDAAIAAMQEQVARSGAEARAAEAEAERNEQGREELQLGRAGETAALQALQARLAAADQAPAHAAIDAGHREALAAATTGARAAEVEVRVALRGTQERASALAGRASGLWREAAAEREAREQAGLRAALAAAEAAQARAVAGLATQAAQRLERSALEVTAVREQAETTRRERETRLAVTGERVAAANRDSIDLRDGLHRDEVARTEQRLAVEGFERRCRDEHALEPDLLVEEYGPHVPVPPDAEQGQVAVFERSAQEKRAAEAERRLARLGTVNPLALEEYAALQERASFLAKQVEDIQRTRRELLGIVRDVDAKVVEVMASAFADTAREFELVFPTLFPGGEGRLVLTDPDDPLTTGVEVEVRPAGKRVSRLSLLSGGERSLAALAFLLAVFRARPSPFYVLDEVEAALDDRNLGRLLDAFEQLRERSQLLIVTHQKRTMEVADALYGVSMRGDGVTTVVSQRLREPLSA